MVSSLEPDFKTQLGCPLLNLHTSDEYNQFDLHVFYLLSVLYMVHVHHHVTRYIPKHLLYSYPTKWIHFFQIYIMIMSLL